MKKIVIFALFTFLIAPFSYADEETGVGKALKDTVHGAIKGAAAVVAGTGDAAETTVEATGDAVEETGKATGKMLGMDKKEEKMKDKDTPEGWSKGEKKGWGDLDTPPGLSQKKNKKK